MNNTLQYRHYNASIHFSIDDNVHYGKVLNLDDLISFEGKSVKELKMSFEEAIADYLEIKTALTSC